MSENENISLRGKMKKLKKSPVQICIRDGWYIDDLVKCEKYWPDNEDILDTGHFEMKVNDTDVRADYTIRHITITSKSTKGQRSVVHYHYTTWPDHGVPNVLSLVKFIWNIRRTDSDTDGPLLIQCSAGIGRTGTYIAVDSLYDQARDEGKVDVPAYVAEMRSQRKNMIQTYEQYECVFLCLVEMTTYGDTSLSSSDFFDRYSSRGMDTEVEGRSLKRLTEMALAGNEDGDQHSSRIWVDGNDGFIVHHSPSLANRTGYLQTVIPPQALTRLLWKLVAENNVETVVIISQMERALTAHEGEVKKYGTFSLTTEKTETLSQELSVATIQLEESCEYPDDTRPVKLYQMSEAPNTDRLSTHLIQQEQLQTLSTSCSPTVILHSNNDRKEAVLLCIMSNILGEIRKDHRVDVISHVRTTVLHCPDATPTQEDVASLYRFSHQCVQLKDSGNVYLNL